MLFRSVCAQISKAALEKGVIVGISKEVLNKHSLNLNLLTLQNSFAQSILRLTIG